jgi:hypothetical protein
VVVLRDAELYGNIASATEVAVGIAVSGSLQAVVAYANPLEPGATHQWTGRVVLAVGDELVVNSGAAGPLAVLSGYLLQ